MSLARSDTSDGMCRAIGREPGCASIERCGWQQATSSVGDSLEGPPCSQAVRLLASVRNYGIVQPRLRLLIKPARPRPPILATPPPHDSGWAVPLTLRLGPGLSHVTCSAGSSHNP